MYGRCRMAYRCMRVPVQACSGCGLDGYSGWVYWVGTPRPPTQPPSHVLRGGPQKQTAKRAPEGPRGLEWVVCGVRGLSGVRRRGRLPGPPCGPGRFPWDPPCPGTLRMPPLGNRARFDVISQKLRQNGEVSPECVEKASLSPYSPKRVRKVTS